MTSATTRGGSALDQAAARLRAARRVVILTGAGVSAESGVPTFRGPSGLWRQFRPEDLATPEAFARDPRLVWEWYAWRRERILAVKPNPAHLAIAGLETRLPESLVVTQNVDGLHALAGSRRLVELHGSLWRVRCLSCRARREDKRAPLAELPPRCDCGGILRPDVVWFGEALPAEALQTALRAASSAELLLVVGTSSLVYPAAALPPTARREGAFVVEVNPEETPLTALAHISLRGKAGDLVPALLGGTP